MTKPDNPDSNSKPLDPSTLIVEAEILIDRTALKAYFKEANIRCLDCPAAEIETFEQGAKTHHFDLKKHLAALNELAKSSAHNPDNLGTQSLASQWAKNLTSGLMRLLRDKPNKQKKD